MYSALSGPSDWILRYIKTYLCIILMYYFLLQHYNMTASESIGVIGKCIS